jgi:Lipoxygenase
MELSNAMPTDTENQPQPKDLFPYLGDHPGKVLARFDPAKPLPPQVIPKPRLVANTGLYTIPVKSVPPLEMLGISGVTYIIEKMPNRKSKLEIMPANLTRCRPDKFSDNFFVERRLNGFNPGKFNHVTQKDWQYVIRYDCSKYKVEPGGILPSVIEARFSLQDESLQVHSIQYELNNTSVTSVPSDADTDWKWAKSLFRSAEFVFQQTQSHLGRTHLNVEQYAMAYYRNIKNNKIVELLEPHFEGLLNINKSGASIIFGDKGVIPEASALDAKQVESLLKDEVSLLNYHTWHPRTQALPDVVTNNYFDRAASTVWQIMEQYVNNFFQNHEPEIQAEWTEIERMSQDLVCHSVLKPELGTLEISNIGDLKKLCVYVIYHSSFLHSWFNYKQYEDGGDIEYASLGLWDEKNPIVKPEDVTKRNMSQVLITWTLSNVKYNPIMENGSAFLKDLLWKHRAEIQPGLPLESIMMRIHI